MRGIIVFNRHDYMLNVCGDVMIAYVNKETIKRQVKVIRDFLAANEISLNQSSAYNCVSKMYGFENWNTFSAFLNKKEVM